MLSLRYYQSDALKALYKRLKSGPGDTVLCLPTGAGKSIVLAKIAEDINKAGKRVLIVTHVAELVSQNAEKCELIGCDTGIYSAGLDKREVSNKVISASVQSIYKRMPELCGSDPFGAIIIDEAHMLSSDDETMYGQLIEKAKLANPKCRVIGLTATPYRTKDGYIYGEGRLFDDCAYEVQVTELIAGGFLCPVTSKGAKEKVSMEGVKTTRGDFDNTEMQAAYMAGDNVSRACKEIHDKCQDRKSVIVFCSGIKHMESVAEELETLEPGTTSTLTGKTAKVQRKNTIQDFKDGKTKYFLNVGTATTGLDVTGIDCVVLLRSTKSPGLYQQMIGRGLRINPDKTECRVLDFGGNVLRHGPIDNVFVREQAGKGNGAGGSMVKECPQCGALVHLSVMTCGDCGHQFPENEKHEAEASDASILSKDPIEIEVEEVVYSVHEKVNDPDAPKTMRVDYYKKWGWGKRADVSEWICLEHDGFAGNKAIRWWQEHTGAPLPQTVDEAVRIANAGALKRTETISYMMDGKYKRVISRTLGGYPYSECPPEGENAMVDELQKMGFEPVDPPHITPPF